MATLPPEKPWYKHPWVWALITIPVVSVILSFSMLWTAITYKDAEVQDDWYKQGKAVAQDFARDEYASALTITADIALMDKQVRINVQSKYKLDDKALPATLSLAFSHPTDDKRDLALTLKKQADGAYVGTIDKALTGRYYVTISTPVWRLKDMIFLPLTKTLTIQPEPIKS
jgi:hypothetical protein